MNIINFEKVQKIFLEYTKKFDLTNANIQRKQQHSIRVMNISEEIAKNEHFPEEEVQIAKLIGLLHDIARFKQYTEHKTFKDKDSFDHGNMGVAILESNNFIRNFIEDNQYDKIIKIAIKNHNKYQIEKGLTPEEKKFCKIIRDADKIDIIWEAAHLFWKGEENKIEESKITKEIKEKFYNQKSINVNEIENAYSINKLIMILAFIFDINYKASFKIIREKENIDKLVNRFNYRDESVKKEMENMRVFLNEYILKMEQK